MISSSRVYANANPNVNDLWVAGSPIGLPVFLLISKCPLDATAIAELLAAFLSVCERVNIDYLWRPNLRDESNNQLIELAVAGNAIATHNQRDFQGADLVFPD